MLLPREFVTYLSRQIVQRVTGTAIETHNPERVVELVGVLVPGAVAPFFHRASGRVAKLHRDRLG